MARSAPPPHDSSATPAEETLGDLFDTDQAAGYLGLNPHTLEVWRCTKAHDLPYIKVGRLVRYRKSALHAWLSSRTVGGAHQ
jgi:excisionase family DNA binding protein